MKFIEINKYKKKIKIIVYKDKIEIIGPLGSLTFPYQNIINKHIFIKKNMFIFFVNRIKTLFRSVSVGWYKELSFKGIGYKCFKMEEKIALDLGYSNLILYKPTENMQIKNLKSKIVLFSINKEYLNNVAILLKNYSIPDTYKGKGIWLKNDVIKLKKKSKT